MGDDKHHVARNKDLTGDRGVEPLEASLGAAKEATLVNEDSAPELNEDVAEDEESLEEEIRIHLLTEKSFAEAVLVIVPVLGGQLALSDRRVQFLVKQA